MKGGERRMCAPISVTTGGGGCTGICRAMPQIFGSLGIVGVLFWNFRDLLKRVLPSKRAA